MSLSQEIRGRIIARCYRIWDIYGKKVLDVGCGNGAVSKVLREELNLDLFGTDIIDYRKVDIPFRQMKKSKELPFDDLSFDYTMFNDILHHTQDIEALILEGGRVARGLLIFEDKPGFLIRIVDVALNYFYSRKMPCPLNFKTQEEWGLLFNELGFDYEGGEPAYPFWYPFRHMVFRLSKRVNKMAQA